MSEKKSVTLTRELCPVCTTELDESVLLSEQVYEEASKTGEKVEEQVHWSKEFCPNCKDMKEKGFILIGAVEAKTTDATNPYRSGNVWCVEQEVAEQLFAPHGAPASGVAFVDVTVAKQMNLPDVNLNA